MVLFLIFLQMHRIYALVNGHILPRYVESDGEHNSRQYISLNKMYPIWLEFEAIWMRVNSGLNYFDTPPKSLQKKCFCTCILYHLHNRIRGFGVAVPSSTFFGSIELLNLYHKSALFWFKFNFVNWILYCKPLQLPKNWTLT